MDYLVLCLTALLASGLTLFSGFGLGTLLLPALALFFPLPVAVAATALVHLANNLFKLALLGRGAVWPVVLRFALPAAAAAFAGAWLLSMLAGLPTLISYGLGAHTAQVTLVKLVIGLLILGFAWLELMPSLEDRLRPVARHLSLGGLLSGFFGGLSGHQGAFRSAFLLRAGLDKQAFVATGVVCAVVVDLARLVVYGQGFLWGHLDLLAQSGGLAKVGATCLAAFAGAYFGKRLLGKVTMASVRMIVAVMMGLVGLGLAAGLI